MKIGKITFTKKNTFIIKVIKFKNNIIENAIYQVPINDEESVKKIMKLNNIKPPVLVINTDNSQDKVIKDLEVGKRRQ